MPLHYGASITRKGGVGHKPYGSTKVVSLARIEKLVRMDLATAQGAILQDADIARVLNCSIFVVRNLRKKREYIQLRMEYTTGISTRAEDTVETMITIRRQQMREMLPQAFKVVADALTNNSTPISIKTKIALEVMDREGTFPKISRTDVHAKVEHNYGSVDALSAEMLSYMSGNTRAEGESETLIQEAIEANRKFSNSQTLSSTEQEAALTALETMPLGGPVQ